MNEITNAEFDEATMKIRALFSEMEALNQPRSNHILRQQVVGQHNMPGRQREQLLTELRGLLFAVENMRDDIELTQCDIDAIEKKIFKGRRDEIELRKLRRRMAEQKFELSGRMREISALMKIAGETKPYTREMLEAEEPENWMRRLSEQAEKSRVQFLTGWNGGDIAAMINLLAEPGTVKPQLGNINQIMETLQIPFAERNMNELTEGGSDE